MSLLSKEKESGLNGGQSSDAPQKWAWYAVNEQCKLG
jgi:hypothetical protein